MPSVDVLMKRPANFLALAAVMGLGLVSACRRPDSARDDAASQDGPPPVRVTAIKPERKTLVRTVNLPGRVEAFEVAPLQAKVTGYVAKMLVDIGDRIHGPQGSEPGSTLCEIAVPELQEEVAEKEAAVAQAKAVVLQADAGVKVAEAAVRSAEAHGQEARASGAKEDALLARWQSESQRLAHLAETGAVTQKVADEARAEFSAADAGRRESVARIAAVDAAQQEAVAALEKAKADSVAARSRLALAEAEHRRATTMLEYSVIRAPFDGVVVARNVHTGHLVQAGGGDGSVPLLTVMRIDPVRVFVDVPESDALYVSPATKVELRIPSFPGDPYVGVVTRSSWSLHTTSRTLTAEIDVPNPDGHWRPGLYVQAALTVAELPNALSLPKTAIFTQDKQTFCFSVEADGTVKRRAVSLGLLCGTDYEIRSGLSGEEHIIGVNPNAFREGQAVEISSPAQ